MIGVWEQLVLRALSIETLKQMTLSDGEDYLVFAVC